LVLEEVENVKIQQVDNGRYHKAKVSWGQKFQNTSQANIQTKQNNKTTKINK
jgi:hypothetical protein